MNLSTFISNTFPNRISYLTFLLLISISFSAIAQESKESFVCTPCDRDCDKLVFDKSGICPHCNMALVKQSLNPKEEKAARVVILLFDGVQIIDFTGPYEVLGGAGYEVVTVAANSLIKTNMGLSVNPNFTFANCPKAGVFIIPGGEISGTRQSAETVKWIKQYSEKSELVMSVCNGALILADTELLNGLTATTYHNTISDLTNENPKIKVVSDQRFVDNGKFITTAGLSSGIDGALHIVEKLQGKFKAQSVALNLEYDWKPGDNYARASLADKYLKKLFEGDDEGHLSITSVKLLSTEGTKDKWKVEFELTSTTTAAEIEKVIEEMIVKKVNWKKEANNIPAKSSWRFTSPEKENWNGFLEVKQVPLKPYNFVATLKIDRDGFK